MSYRIAIIANTSWYLYNFRLNLMKAFKKRGFEVFAIAPKDDYSTKLIEGGFDNYFNIKLNNKGKNPVEDIITTYRFYKIYRKIKPDLVLHYTSKPNIYGTLAANKLNIPTINNISGLGSIFIEQSFLTKIVKLLYRFSQNRATYVFFQNKDDLELFLKQKLVEKNKSVLLPGSGVDLDKYKPQFFKRKDNVFRFLLIARMLWDKGVGEYVEAAKIIKSKNSNVEFQLLGFLDAKNPTAISSEKMKEWVKRGDISYLGSTDDTRQFMKNVDCVVLPSYREGIPRSLLEAAACAKPIITTKSIGCKEVVDDGINGFLCKPKDVSDLADKMEKMINLTNEKRRKMGLAGRDKMVNEFDEKIVINKYIEMISKIKETNIITDHIKK